MAIQDDKTLLCKGDLKAYHESISPDLGGNLMLGTNVSDYYETTEKIVGVWTNGKPIYQLTIIDTMPKVTTAGTYVTKNITPSISNVDLIFVKNSFVIDSGSISRPMPYTLNSGYQSKVSAAKTYLQVSSAIAEHSQRPVYITIQYTKTTDAANSATTTPGCYDINFPNTWPVNKEIFFGNGLYGYRETGIITQGASQLNMKTLNPTNVTKMINCGGQWYHGSEYISLNGCNQDYQKSGLVLSGNQISLRTYSNQVRTNAPYDIWVTYTK